MVHSFFLLFWKTFLENFFGKIFWKTQRKLLTKESQSDYRVYATGRKNVKSLTLNLNMLARQDLFYTILSFFTGTKDTITLELPLNTMTA